jgi:hypothetical protein
MDEPTALVPQVAARSLDELVRERGALPVEQAVPLLIAIAHALVTRTREKGVQAPLDPRTIRLTLLDGVPPAVQLLDSDSTVDLSPGAEAFSLGVVAFMLLVGRSPKLDETLHDALPTAPTAVERLVARLLAPSASERPSSTQAHEQLLELAPSLAELSVRAASPLSSPPLIKRGPAIGELRTDARAWAVNTHSEGTELVPPHKPAEPNPFADDEATATVRGPLSSDEDTQYTRGARDGSETYQRPGYRTGDRAPLAPPVPTQMSSRRVDPSGAPLGDEPFEATKGDLMGRTLDEPPTDPSQQRRRVRRREHPPLEQLFAFAARQPPWVWGAIGMGLAFFVLLLIALAR